MQNNIPPLRFACGPLSKGASLRSLVLTMTISVTCFSSDLSLDDRLFDTEAKINILDSKFDQIKDVALQERANAFNPSIGLSVDILGQYGFGVEKHHEHDHEHSGEHDHHHHHGHEFKNGFLIREAEIEFKASIDPFADGVVSLAIEQESASHFHLHIEEAFADLNLFALKLRLGRFRSSFGRMNLLHRHALPQIPYAEILKQALGEEGLFGQGISLSHNLAFLKKQSLLFFLEGYMGVKTPLQKNGAENYPSGLARLWWHSQYGAANYLDVGISNYIGAIGKNKNGFFNLLGADIHYAYKPSDLGAEALFLFGHESFLAFLSNKEDRLYGNFTWAQLRILPGTFFGLRYDLNQKDEKEFSHSASAFLTYYTSEFLRFRLGYEHFMPDLTSINGDHRLMFNVVFIIGSHPQDPYIANR